MVYIGRGVSRMVSEEAKNGYKSQGFSVPRSFSGIIEFIKREIMGKEE
jgi:hypothetical protein